MIVSPIFGYLDKTFAATVKSLTPLIELYMIEGNILISFIIILKPGRLIPFVGIPKRTIQDPGLAVLADKSKVSSFPTQSTTLSYFQFNSPAPNICPAST